ncbi:hypothetical protein JIN85_01130 [Luteolibacter pohnpeiensis]|uniref:Uncharacterized protein n=1 Tax=Luteolibacter pohnpeiensis TaxID=454153 RepID=A0A934S4D7_9BACT|nr:hypothetical protein [Luteolibacter pohnpeiensis]MBK1880995.1 hypothetical protein [Luteolibacter pohnpeiensis]
MHRRTFYLATAITVLTLAFGKAIYDLVGVNQNGKSKSVAKSIDRPKSSNSRQLSTKSSIDREVAKEKTLVRLNKKEAEIQSEIDNLLSKIRKSDPQVVIAIEAQREAISLMRTQEMNLRRLDYNDWMEYKPEQAAPARQMAIIKAYRELLNDPKYRDIVRSGLELQKSFLTNDYPLISDAHELSASCQEAWGNGKIEIREPGIIPQEIGIQVLADSDAVYQNLNDSIGNLYQDVPGAHKTFIEQWIKYAVISTSNSLIFRKRMPLSYWVLKHDLLKTQKEIQDNTSN